MIATRVEPISGEVRTPFYCAHPFYGYVCRPNAVLDFSDTVPPSFGHGALATIGPEGFRNERLVAAKPSDEVWIALLGGSVAFCAASSTNATTISAYLERELNDRAPVRSRRRVHVWNFALPAAQQPQQAAILLGHVTDLDGVITFDGVNEAIIPHYFNKRIVPDHFPFRPIYELLYGRTITEEQAALTWAIEETETWPEQYSSLARLAVERLSRQRVVHLRQRLQHLSGATDTFRSSFPCGNPDEAVDRWVDPGVQRWKEMILSMHAVATARHIDTTFVLQPMPERDKPLTAEEQQGLDQYPDMVALRRVAYPRLHDAAADLAARGIDCVDFSGVFSGVAAPVYTDHIHFEDRGCAIVARALAAHILQNWTSLR